MNFLEKKKIISFKWSQGRCGRYWGKSVSPIRVFTNLESSSPTPMLTTFLSSVDQISCSVDGICALVNRGAF